jgi:L-lactate dehydrogenase complex protein LldG
MSRDAILAALKRNQPEISPLPADLSFETAGDADLVSKFKAMAEGIGSTVFLVSTAEEIKIKIAAEFAAATRVVTNVASLVSPEIAAFVWNADPHTYEDVDVAVFQPRLGVAENSALWITEDRMGVRALPFITHHIVMVVDIASLVPDMHTAYQVIGEADYGFATFIAGPSKTADIEQSLVLGAHGPRSMTIFLCAFNEESPAFH